MGESKTEVELSRDREFPALKDMVYLDHAGTTLVSRRQLEAHHSDILSNIYGNPHSRSLSSQLTSDTIDQVRYRILRHFNTSPDEYSVIFTSGCTASLKLLAESFDFHGNCCHGTDSCVINLQETVSSESHDSKGSFEGDSCHGEMGSHNNHCCHGENYSTCTCCCQGGKNDRKTQEYEGQLSCCHAKTSTDHHGDICSRKGSFTYLMDNHTSVQGMRELAFQKAGQVRCVDCDFSDNILPSTVKVLSRHKKFKNCGNHLFAYPAQSNFSGRKYPQDWITLVKQRLMAWQRSNEGQEEPSCQCEGHWYSVLDAASFVSTSHLDLGDVKPDFVSVSFYKMFAYPTGLGALLVKNDSGHLLKKTYFGGGTVAVSLPTQRHHVSRTSLSEKFEDGTVSFLDIISLRHGFDVLQNLGGGIESISKYTFHLAKYFHHSLSSCLHGNGFPLAIIYCAGEFEDIKKQGAIVNFNLLRSNGEYIGFSEVDKLAQLHDIHVRTGCFCNIGACQQFLHISDEQIVHNFDAGHVCGDDRDLIDGKPTGSVRVSFGYMSTMEDAQKCLQFIVDCFMEHTNKPVYWDNKLMYQSDNMAENKILNQSVGQLFTDSTEISLTKVQSVKTINTYSGISVTDNDTSVDFSEIKETQKDIHVDRLCSKTQTIENCVGFSIKEVNALDDKSTQFVSCEDKHLSDIFLYPVKSCAAFKVQQWPLSARGLLYDREWMIVTESGIAMSQKRESRLCLLRPSIDLEKQRLRLEYPGMEPIHVPLMYEETMETETSLCNSKVCGDRVKSINCGMAVSDWLSEALQRPGCRLIRQKSDDTRSSKLKTSSPDVSGVDDKSHLSLANESQYLLISRESVAMLHEKILERRENGDTTDSFDRDNLLDRFRGNLVVSGCDPFEEDKWARIQIGNINFKSQGMCTRCQMICLDQQTGERSREPLKTLAVWRGRKVPFGIHLCGDVDGDTDYPVINVGDPVFVS